MTYVKYLLLLAFCLIPPDIFAGVFDVVVTDKSKEYLGVIFGGSVGAVTLGGGANPLLSKMFERFNFVIITFGVLILSYTGVVAAINTAREGEALGKKFSLWVPLRSLFGMLMMLPSPSSGYSVIQMTVIWVVLNGVGAANTIWNIVVDQLAGGIRAVGQLELENKSADGLSVDLQAQINGLTEDILKMSACKNVLNQLNLEFTKNHGPITVNFPKIDQSLITPRNTLISPHDITDPQTKAVVVRRNGISGYNPSATITVGAAKSTRLDLAICGHIDVSVTANYTDPNFSAATALNHLQTKVNAVKAVFETVEPTAQALSKLSLPAPEPLPGTFLTAYRHYMAQNVQLVVTPTKTNATQKANILKSFGWIHAGGYYFALTQGKKVNSANAINLPTPTDFPSYNQQFKNDDHAPTGFTASLNTVLQNVGNKKELNEVLKRVEDFAEEDAQNTPGLPSLGSDYPLTKNKFLDKTLEQVLQGIRTPILKFFSSAFAEKTVDPLLSIGSLGADLMLAGELTVFGLVVGAFLTMLAASSGGLLNPLPWAPQILLFTVIPGLAALLVLVWTMGATLGIYVPMIPYLIFTATAIGWMLAVIEAVVAAPIIALGLIQPSGEELGKIVPALGILINIFLKPTLMIFGFVMAGSLLRAILNMINFGFTGALNVALPYPTFFSIIPVLALYTFLVIGVVNQAFSLIYELPNKALRYIGITSEGSNPEKLIGETKGGIDKGSQAAQEVQKGAADQAAKQGGEAGKKIGRRGPELPRSAGPAGGGGPSVGVRP